MSVLKGEGKVPIIFSSTSISAGARTHTAYLARPDLTGEWPTMVVLPSAWGLTGAAKDLTRRLARQGFVAVCPDLYAGKGPARSTTKGEATAALRAIPVRHVQRDLVGLVDFVTNPTGFWSNAEDGFGIVGVGEGGRFGADLAARRGGAPLALVGTPLRVHDSEESGPEGRRAGESSSGESDGSASNAIGSPDVMVSLGSLSGPLIGLYGREDIDVPIADVMDARDEYPHAEWVLYSNLGADFLDDYLPGFDAGAQTDVVDRLAEFFGKHLPQVRRSHP